MKSIYPPKIQRLAWLEGIRFFAAVAILLYHFQLLFSDYAFAPQGTGLGANWDRILGASGLFGQHWGGYGLSLGSWFGYQFVDWFVLVSGFSLVLSLKGKPLAVGAFLKERLWRILLPFWTTGLLAYPVLWAVGGLTNTYSPDAWHSFAGLTFPLLFEFGGRLLLSTSGPWWFVPLIVSFAIVFPGLWKLAERWGMGRLVGASIAVTLIYRLLSVYILGGHPTYAMQETVAGWQPFVPFVAKLGTFVVGMAVAVTYTQGRGVMFWSGRRALGVGLPLYTLGFVCQFYALGWVVADGLIALGLGLVTMALFRPLARLDFLGRGLTYLGKHSYSYFLVHNFVIDRLVRLWVKQDLDRYYWGLLFAILGTFGLALVIDALTPWVERGLVKSARWIDRQMARPAINSWLPMVEDLVLYQGQWGWQISQVERVEHSDRTFYLCRISRMGRTLWVNQQDLVLDEDRDRSTVGRSVGKQA
jgi:peptidoglycan/LPS O-acetylase OafA/YrhL